MIHRNRVWNVKEYDDAAELAHKLTQFTWTLCSGFSHRGILYLNDSFSEDGAAEFGVVREADGVQFESVTFGWMAESDALKTILGYTESQPDFNFGTLNLSKSLAHPVGSQCERCA